MSSSFQSQRRRYWRWCKLTVLASICILAILGVFWQPILRWTINNWGPQFLEKKGASTTFKVEQGFWGGIDVSDFSMAQPNGVLDTFRVAQLQADYSISSLIRHRGRTGLERVKVKDAEIILNLTGPKKPRKSSKNRAPRQPGISMVWLPEVNLDNVSLTLKGRRGDLILHGISINWDTDGKGKIAVRHFKMPGTSPIEIRDLKGDLEWDGKTLKLRKVFVNNVTEIERLDLYTEYLPIGELPLFLQLRSNQAQVTLGGALQKLGAGFELDIIAALNDVTDQEVRPWANLPKDLHWQLVHGALRVQGNPAKPQQLNYTIKAFADEVQVKGMRFEDIYTDLQQGENQLIVHSAIGHYLGNRLEFSGPAVMPERWRDLRYFNGEYQYHVTASDLTALSRQEALSGVAEATGKVKLVDSKQVTYTALFSGQGIRWLNDYHLKVEGRLEGDLNGVHVEELRAYRDQDIGMKLQGDLVYAAPMEFGLNWYFKSTDLSGYLPLSLQKSWSNLEGELESKAQITGTISAIRQRDWKAFKAKMDLQGHAKLLHQPLMQQADMQLKMHDGVVIIEPLLVQIDADNQLQLKGHLNLNEALAADLRFKLQAPVVERFNPWLEALKLPAVEKGRINVDVSAQGELKHWRTIKGDGLLSIEGLKLSNQAEIMAVEMQLHHDGKQVNLDQLSAQWGDWKLQGKLQLEETEVQLNEWQVHYGPQRIFQLSGIFPLDWQRHNVLAGTPLPLDKHWQLQLNFEQLPVGKLVHDFTKIDGLTGDVSGSFYLGGMPANPTADLQLQWVKAGHRGSEPYLSEADVTLDVKWQDADVHVNLGLNQKPLQPLTLQAQIPLALEAILQSNALLSETPIQAQLRLPASDISWLKQWLPAVETLRGQVALDLDVSGQLNKPLWQGQLRTDIDQLRLKKVEMHARDLKVHLDFDQRVIRANQVYAAVSGGELRLNGQVDFQELTNPQFDLELLANEALVVRDETMSLRSDGRIQIKGNLDQAAVIGGLDLVRGRVFKEIEFIPISLPNQLPPAPVSVTSKKTELTLPPALDAWTFDVGVKTRDPIRLLGNILNGGVSVNIHMGGTGAHPLFSGKAVTDEVRLKLPFSRMNITKGEVLMDPQNVFNPQLDIHGDSFVNNYRVAMQVYGSVATPQVRFTSSPPLSEAEIATLLATGATSGDLKSSEGLAANRAAFMLISQTYRKWFKKAAPTRHDDEPSKLSFSFSPLNTGGSQRSITATYELSPKVQAAGIVGEEGNFRGLLYYLIRFK